MSECLLYYIKDGITRYGLVLICSEVWFVCLSYCAGGTLTLNNNCFLSYSVSGYKWSMAFAVRGKKHRNAFSLKFTLCFVSNFYSHCFVRYLLLHWAVKESRISLVIYSQIKGIKYTGNAFEILVVENWKPQYLTEATIWLSVQFI